MVVGWWSAVDGRQLTGVAVVSGRRWLIVVAGWRSSLVGDRRWSSLVGWLDGRRWLAGCRRWLVGGRRWLVVVAGWLVVGVEWSLVVGRCLHTSW